MKDTPTQTTEDREAELKRLEEQTRTALIKAMGRAAKEASTLKLTPKQREKVEKIVQQTKAELRRYAQKAKQ
jgi:hypothetical protein